jgi:hypothetical protein
MSDNCKECNAALLSCGGGVFGCDRGLMQRDGSERSMASNRWQPQRAAAPAPSPSHSADATCRPGQVSTAAIWKEGKRAARVAAPDAVRLPQQLHHWHWRRDAGGRKNQLRGFDGAANSADTHHINGCCSAWHAQRAPPPRPPIALARGRGRSGGASKNRSSAISACVSRASLQMAAPWRGG